jgi:hypothetical protein
MYFRIFLLIVLFADSTAPAKMTILRIIGLKAMLTSRQTIGAWLVRRTVHDLGAYLFHELINELITQLFACNKAMG